MKLGFFWPAITLLIIGIGLWNVANNRRDARPHPTPASKPPITHVKPPTPPPRRDETISPDLWMLVFPDRTMETRITSAPRPPKVEFTVTPEYRSSSSASYSDDRDDRIAELESEVSELKSQLDSEPKPPRRTARYLEPSTRTATIRLNDGTRLRATVPDSVEPGPVDIRNEDGERIRGWLQ